jgi:hypothetical protein
MAETVQRAASQEHQGPQPPGAQWKVEYRWMEPQAALQPARTPGAQLALVRAVESE